MCTWLRLMMPSNVGSDDKAKCNIFMYFISQMP